VDQEYLPESLAGRQFYFAKSAGAEGPHSAWWKKVTKNRKNQG
jgi:replication-associated recombination protein RarA